MIYQQEIQMLLFIFVFTFLKQPDCTARKRKIQHENLKTFTINIYYRSTSVNANCDLFWSPTFRTLSLLDGKASDFPAKVHTYYRHQRCSLLDLQKGQKRNCKGLGIILEFLIYRTWAIQIVFLSLPSISSTYTVTLRPSKELRLTHSTGSPS